jgi:hypothetical protein
LSRRGEVAVAMLQAAWPPAPVTHLCERAQIGYGVGRYTASRLVQAGELVVLAVEPPVPGRTGRPAAVVASREALRQRASEMVVPGVLPLSFWDTSAA